MPLAACGVNLTCFLLHCLPSINGELRKHETRAQKLSFLITNFNTQLAAQQRLRQTPRKLIQKRNGIKDLSDLSHHLTNSMRRCAIVCSDLCVCSVCTQKIRKLALRKNTTISLISLTAQKKKRLLTPASRKENRRKYILLLLILT